MPHQPVGPGFVGSTTRPRRKRLTLLQPRSGHSNLYRGVVPGSAYVSSGRKVIRQPAWVRTLEGFLKPRTPSVWNVPPVPRPGPAAAPVRLPAGAAAPSTLLVEPPVEEAKRARTEERRSRRRPGPAEAGSAGRSAPPSLPAYQEPTIDQASPRTLDRLIDQYISQEDRRILKEESIEKGKRRRAARQRHRQAEQEYYPADLFEQPEPSPAASSSSAGLLSTLMARAAAASQMAPSYATFRTGYLQRLGHKSRAQLLDEAAKWGFDINEVNHLNPSGLQDLLARAAYSVGERPSNARISGADRQKALDYARTHVLSGKGRRRPKRGGCLAGCRSQRRRR